MLDAVLTGAEAVGARTSLISLAEADVTEAVAKLGEADAFVIGSPVHRGSYATPLKALIDRTPRGRWGETEQPLTARAVGMVLTGAQWSHYLALDGLRSVLAGFFAAHVLSPGLYVPGEGFGPDKNLVDSFATEAASQGAALVALAEAVAGSQALRAVEPQV
ncbi:hypothetical protein GCM10011609_35520 [Lentzea pudingi]|uniref:NADPH-dependent FMN reductase-like domain-containing protein n=1 Tax=Lentzea pudingi TaxID=1789439 RepID=A0ABQ2HXX0_9PSEU|nr:hypothetical protein GCM10011609_35520 [Lentzea pudingi]